MTKSHNLKQQGTAPPEAGYETVEKGTKDCAHALNAMACHGETLGFLRRMEFIEGTASIDDNAVSGYCVKAGAAPILPGGTG
jgi:hypothetical protein